MGGEKTEKTLRMLSNDKPRITREYVSQGLYTNTQISHAVEIDRQTGKVLTVPGWVQRIRFLPGYFELARLI